MTTPTLLRGTPHTVEHDGQSLDFQVRVGRPTAGSPAEPTPCVVIVTRTADDEADDLSLRLAAAGVPLVRVDADRCDAGDLTWDESSETLWVDGQPFAPVVSWKRYFTPGAVPAPTDAVLADYGRRQWDAIASVLTAAARNTIDAAGAPDRIIQLSEARRAGLGVPPTIVTTRPGTDVRMLPGDGDVIVKSVGDHYLEPTPGRLHGLFPRRFDRSALAATGPEPAPVIVQAFVPSRRELRVFAVDGDFFAFEVNAPSVDAAANDPETVEVVGVAVPDTLADPLSRLVARWGLDVAAFDVLDADTGPVFLEVNAPCSWRFYDRRAGTTVVSSAVTDLLVNRFTNGRSTT